MSAGRPSKYSKEIADKICELIATTQKSMATICKEVGIPYGTHLEWVRSNEEYSKQYARAKEDQADLLAEQILEISDDKAGDLLSGEFGEVGNTANIQRARLQVDSRKWIAAKLKPKKYGDKIEHSGSIHIEQPLFPDVRKDDSN